MGGVAMRILRCIIIIDVRCAIGRPTMGGGRGMPWHTHDLGEKINMYNIH